MSNRTEVYQESRETSERNETVPCNEMSSKTIEPNDQTTPPHPHPSKSDIAGDSSNDENAPDNNSPEILVTIPSTILHLIDAHCSVELAIGDLTVFRLLQGGKAVAVVASVSDDIQWPLSKDLTAVKLDSYHYFFSFQPPKNILHHCDSSSSSSSSSSDDEDDDKKKLGKNKKNEEIEILNYGLTIISSGHEELLTDFDSVLECYCNFTVQKVEFQGVQPMTKVESLEEFESDQKKREMVEGQCAVYWTTLAPNVEEYSGLAARLVAAGSGQLVKGILWCGDVAVERLKWGNEVLRKRIASGDNTEIDPRTLKRIKRVKKVTKMTEKVATGVLSGVIRVTGFFTGSVANSKVGKKFFGLLPGEVVLASLDGFSRICDAVEVAGKNVMSTTSTVTTGLVSHRYGEEAAKAACEGFDAAGHAVGTAWAVFKIRQALNPKSVMKPTALAKAAAKSAKRAKKKKG